MVRRLALLLPLLAACACNAPEQAQPPAPLPVAAVPAAPLSQGQIQARTDKCAADSRERFRNDASQGILDAQGALDFAQHYNARLDTCFLLLTMSSPENPGGEFGGSPALVVRRLIDVNENELYGVYLGPPADAPPPGHGPHIAHVPGACEVMSMYCASGREWEVLVREFMEG